jgi:pyruvate/2-oxoglutarate dehydrogenase complex dihydrolipoamide acyltransferase (E2) component
MSDVFAVIVPLENINDEFATLIEWNVGSGKEVKKGDVIVTLETMKAIFEIEAEKDGFLFYEIKEGAEVRVGSEIAYICDENKRPKIVTKPTGFDTSKSRNGSMDISAKAMKLMDEYGLRDEDFAGFEKVKLEDVKTKIAERSLKKKDAHAAISSKEQYRTSSKIFEISPAKRFEIKQLRQSSQRVIASSVSVVVDLQKVEENIKHISRNDGVRPTIVELTIFHTSRLLKKYNLFNGFYDDGNCNVYNEINVGFAVNIGKGLKVPVIKGADKLLLKEISNTVKDLGLKYFREELVLSDLAGGTFTVTDLSAKGIVDFSPIINNMQAAILGICSAMPGTGCFKIILTFDHNMADGMMAADMLNELSALLQGK